MSDASAGRANRSSVSLEYPADVSSTRDELRGQPAADSLTEILARQRPPYSDLLDQLGAPDFFVIDGDSLLLDCLSSSSVSKFGGQMSTLFFLLERFLHDLCACQHSTFEFVFFRRNDVWWRAFNQPFFSLARTVLQQHLRQVLRYTVHQHFESWWSSDWLEFVQQRGPAFYLTTDLACSSKLDLPQAILPQVQLILQMSALHMLSNRTAVAFLQDIRFHQVHSEVQDQMYGFKLTTLSQDDKAALSLCGESPAMLAERVYQSLVQGFQDWMVEGFQHLVIDPDVMGFRSSWGFQKTTGTLGSVNWSTRAGMWACACLVKRMLQSSNHELADTLLMIRAWCCHHVGLTCLPLVNRCLDVEAQQQAASCPNLSYFISAWCTAVGQLLASTTMVATANELTKADLAGLVDLYDGRLWHFMGSCLSAKDMPIGLPSSEACEAAECMQLIVCQLAGIDTRITSHYMGLRQLPITAKQPCSWYLKRAQQAVMTTLTASQPVGPALAQHNMASNSLISDLLGRNQLASQEAHQIMQQGTPEASLDASFGSVSSVLSDWETAREQPVMPHNEHQPLGQRTPPLVRELPVELPIEPPSAPAFMEVHHWHTGKEIDDTYWSHTAQQRKLTKWLNLPLWRYQTCYMLTEDQRTRVKDSNILSNNDRQTDKLHEAKQRDGKLRQVVHGWLRSAAGTEEQMYYRFLQRYAATLQQAKYTKGKTDAALTAASSIVKSQQPAQADKMKQWTQRRAGLEAELSTTWKQSDLIAVDAFLKTCTTAASASAYLAASVFKLENSWKAYKQYCQAAARQALPLVEGAKSLLGGTGAVTDDDDAALAHAMTVWATVQDLLDGRRMSLTHSEKALVMRAFQLCLEAMQGFGFQGTVERLEYWQATLATPSNLDPVASLVQHIMQRVVAQSCSDALLPNSNAAQPSIFPAGQSEARFQLKYMGDRLPRETPPMQDARVANFNPDVWQRRVLDAIDDRASCVVCAPTSSGKTFISSYCMASVLEDATFRDGIVVIVCPTKALVNQTSAQVYADFARADRTVHGVFTKDYRSKVLESRVLVTVPECLEILLLAPKHRTWVQKIRYVIFDEIHCIMEGGLSDQGNAISRGAVWEHCLLLIRCPFLALSASVGNPGELRSWLQSVKTMQMQQDISIGKGKDPRSYDVRFVQHSGRYADLRCYTYASTSSYEDSQQQAGRGLRRLHPFAVLDAKLLDNPGVPSELTLEPADSLDLYDAMSAVLHADSAAVSSASIGLPASSSISSSIKWLLTAEAALRELAPDVYFAAQRGREIMRTSAREWEGALAMELHRWHMLCGSAGKIATKRVLTQLNVSSGWNEPELPPDRLSMNAMLEELRQQNLLPAIVFKLSQKGCKELAGDLVSALEARQKREGTGSGTATDLRRERFYSFAGKSDMDEQEVQELIEDATKGMDKNGVLVKAPRWGIGVHHAGVSIAYRRMVERMFRAKRMRVVFATGTLASGINMPCRTVVFAKDSRALSPLLFRQMSGRAGRRGFDTLGHAVFFDIPRDKCASLLVSPMPSIYGNFPMSVTLVLRALLLHAGKDTDEEAKHDLLRLLQRPYYAAADAQLQQKMEHMLQFSLQYLSCQHLLDHDGKGVNLAGVASHLFWVEPANYAFLALLNCGLFHKICAPVQHLAEEDDAEKKLPKDVGRALLLVLSHLFQRVRLPTAALQARSLCGGSLHSKKDKSEAMLEEMSCEAQAHLSKHDHDTTRLLVECLQRYVVAHVDELPAANVLPLSHISLPANLSSSGHCSMGNRSLGRGQSAAVNGALQQYRKHFVLLSPFVAISGREEHFNSVEEVVQCMRPGMLLNAASLPCLSTTNRYGLAIPLNSYILDWWRHGQIKLLETKNDMQEDDAWANLKQFTDILRTISSAMSVMVNTSAIAADPVVWSFRKLAEWFEEKQGELNQHKHRRSKHGKRNKKKVGNINCNSYDDFESEEVWKSHIASLRKGLVSKGLKDAIL